MSSSELVFKSSVEAVVAAVGKTFSRVATIESDMADLLIAAFTDAAAKGEKGTELPMFLEFTDIAPEETWALAHKGYILTRSPGDFRNAKVYAKPSAEYAQFYQMNKSPAAQEGAGASGAK